MVDAAKAWDFEENARVAPLGNGLINQTYGVWNGDQLSAILQRLNTDIFSPLVHEDIAAVSRHLAEQGMPTTRLVPTRLGQLWHTDDSGTWRALTPIGDRTLDKLTQPKDALAAGALVAQFHRATANLDWEFRSVRVGAHDTEAHMAGLNVAVDTLRDHRLWWDTASLWETITAGWVTWTGDTDLPKRVIHGDLKISNLRFTGDQAVALIDLDTLAMGTLDIELGDALRSWCNPAAEDTTAATFELDLFEAAMRGYASQADPSITEREWMAIVPGIERVCWELAARFARDALEERYFGWNPQFGGRGEHNLLRARGQTSLAKSVRKARAKAQLLMKSLR